MSLKEQQNFLARLYTDERLRRKFLAAPEKAGAAADLSPAEIAELARVMPEELDFFAESLYFKRLREAEKFLPLARAALGERFAGHFREFAARYNPQSTKKHLEDALEFSARLAAQNLRPVWARDAVRYEHARLTFRSGARRFIFLPLRFDVARMLSDLHAERKLANEYGVRKSFAAWLRIGGRERHFIR